ncbi:hypothetical protein SAMN05443287_107191 [Micromonospora phaseoli]|uniref:LPXTG-motif cell wall anchor domain-containing protein n=1 Tax=Micromonospora phaseoli TaxID=1144548 RepID=A0A1H7BGR8_9ACTN|nr:hypothetical protein [Micromonospora phaseoli]PZV95033.1 hypothetical protein CLV64_108171 [Micromonospora phaseoli]GIJ79542.1 hypothetical protein Xph01_39740 [Micromonospora phaseoli]SEJ75517.1 hypothetical protein SAMN05443287_107191 [Micromonospora phaseoli]
MAIGRRWLSRAAVAALLLAGIAVPSAPASAVDPDPAFTFELTGTTVPVGIRKKTAHLKVTNLADQTPTEVLFRVRPIEPPDWSDKASLDWEERGASGDCDGDSGSWYCSITKDWRSELLPAPGGTADIPVAINVRGTPEPFEGRVVIEVGLTWGDRTTEVTERKEFTLAFVDDTAADLSVVAPDVKQSVRTGASGQLESTGTLNPGETGAVRYRIVNQGRKAVSGVTATVRLPEGVTFTRPPQECAIDDDGRSAVCTYDSLALVPADQDTDPNDSIHSAVELHNLVTVPADIKAPVTLTGGMVQVEGLTSDVDARSGPQRTVLPANAVAVPAADVDASDNQDGFAVVVAVTADDGDGGGGGLPVTGPQAGPLAGAGLAIVAAGIVLLLARRRRSVAFVSGDDTTAS